MSKLFILESQNGLSAAKQALIKKIIETDDQDIVQLDTFLATGRMFAQNELKIIPPSTVDAETFVKQLPTVPAPQKRVDAPKPFRVEDIIKPEWQYFRKELAELTKDGGEIRDGYHLIEAGVRPASDNARGEYSWKTPRHETREALQKMTQVGDVLLLGTVRVPAGVLAMHDGPRVVLHAAALCIAGKTGRKDGSLPPWIPSGREFIVRIISPMQYNKNVDASSRRSLVFVRRVK